MDRKVFISFLGSTNYRSCYYVKGSFISSEVRYVQEAALCYFNELEKWNDGDKAFVLVTDGENGSYKKNWCDNGHLTFDTNKLIKQSGLKSQLAMLEFPFETKDVHIKEGNSEEEIWEIFSKIFELLHENDEVFIDITHGFRYLPMFSIVLANYGKLLKNISVKSISYGNYESRNTSKNEAPIIDLTSFSQLQDWTNAANLFVNHGSTTMLSSLMKDTDLEENLKLFSAIHNTVRAKELFSGRVADDLSSKINLLKIELPPFDPIKKKILKILNSYKKDDIINNGLSAIKYCIDFKLVQQGITIMYEFIITLVLLDIKEDWEKQYNRDTVSGCLNISNYDAFENNFLKEKLNKEVEQKKMLESEKEAILIKQDMIARKVFTLKYIKRLSNKILKKIAHGSRNDINHAGIRPSPKEAFAFEKSLEKYYIKLKELVINRQVK